MEEGRMKGTVVQEVHNIELVVEDKKGKKKIGAV